MKIVNNNSMSDEPREMHIEITECMYQGLGELVEDLNNRKNVKVRYTRSSYIREILKAHLHRLGYYKDH